MKNYNFVYKTVFDDGRYYIGQHKTDNLNDGYFGSSKVVKDLVKQGINYNREILRYCNTQQELNYWEKYYIGDKWQNDPLCLNESNVCGIRDNIQLSEEHKRKLSEARKGKIPWNKGKKVGALSEETKQKLREKNLGSNNPNYGTKWTDTRKQLMSKKLKNRKFSEETKQKMSEARKGKIPWNKGLKISKILNDNI